MIRIATNIKAIHFYYFIAKIIAIIQIAIIFKAHSNSIGIAFLIAIRSVTFGKIYLEAVRLK